MTVLTTDRAAPAETPQDWHPKIRRLMDYWQSVHPAEGLLPGRQHVDPGAIANLLPHLFLVDAERVPLRFKIPPGRD